MKISKLAILGMFLMVILTLGAASASDDMDNLTTADDNVISSVEEDTVADFDPVSGELINEDLEYDAEIHDCYLEGESKLFGFGSKFYDGDVIITIDDDVVLDSSLIPYELDENGSIIGGNFIDMKYLNLSYGQHQYKIDYSGDGWYYKGFTLTGSFNYTYIMINVPDEVYLEEYDDINQDIQIKLSPNATGNIEVLFNNETFYNNNITESDITISLNNLSAGTYDYQVIYSGGNRDDLTKTGVLKKDYLFRIDKKPDYLKYETTFEFRLPGDANSPITVAVGNKTYRVNISSGKGKITLNNSEILNAGLIDFSYEDDKYPLRLIEINASQLKIFTESTDTRSDLKYRSFMDVFYFEGESNGKDPSKGFGIAPYYDCNGTVSIIIDGEQVYCEDACKAKIYEEEEWYAGEGSVFTIHEIYGGNFIYLDNLNLTYGNHDYALIYSGSENHKGFVRNGTFGYDYIRIRIPSVVNVPEYVLDVYSYLNVDSVMIDVPKFLTGNIEVLFDNETYSKGKARQVVIDFWDGNGIFDKLDAGLHECTVIYSGGNRDDRTVTKVFNLDYPLNITYESDNDVNYETTFEFKLPVPDATSSILNVALGNKTYNVTITSDEWGNGQGNITLSNMELLSADSIIFSHKSDFCPLKTIEMNASQLNLTAKFIPEITIDTSDSILEGSDLTVNVTIPNATGNVVINGKEYALVDGRAFAVIFNLGAGVFTVDVVYNGDDRYFNATESKSVNVIAKPVPDLRVTADNIYVGKTAVVNISINEDATGQVTVKIAGNIYSAPLAKGSASLSVNDLPAGFYDVVVSYPGDDKYASTFINANLTVADNSGIVGIDASVMYLANSKYTVTVYGTDGKPANGVDVVFKINGNQVGQGKTNENGMASYTVKKTPGTYTITATALGKSLSNKLTVKHVVKLKKVKVKRSAKKLVLTATLNKVNGKYIKNKKVTFKFKGKKYTAKTNKKGVAKLTIKSKVLKKLKVGNKVTYQATYKGDTVKKTVKVKK